MALIKPFKALRPKPEVAARVAALPYDVYNWEEALAEIRKEPLSFLKIDRAETLFSQDINPYDIRVYKKAKEILEEMKSEGLMIEENESCYYIYQLVMDGNAQTGIAGCASIDDYLNDVIKKHEKTREEKELDRFKHVDICNAQTGPIFMAYRANPSINAVVESVKQKKALYDFMAADGVRHTVWRIEEQKNLDFLYREFQKIQNIYIADGHHRAASAVKVGLQRRKENQDFTGEEEYNYFLAVLFPHDQLRILDYNRVVKDLNGYSSKEFLKEVAKYFLVEEIGLEPYQPKNKATFGMYLEGVWYKLTAKDEILCDDPVEGLDVSLLQNYLLKPILNIKDPRTDQRIDFVGGIRGLKELERRVNTDMKVAFALYPTTINELFAVADAGLLMPPKSTWFEPKLRSGLFIHEL
ncbi:MAG TPA: DUF1015 domain-containing protein [Peptococcaceae bacterium]|nr:DUF1015 domain-containing protein [Peptococcaceae bacterium]